MAKISSKIKIIIRIITVIIILVGVYQETGILTSLVIGGLYIPIELIIWWTKTATEVMEELKDQLKTITGILGE